MAVLPTGIGPVTGGYNIERSLRFNSADSAYLNRTPASNGTRTTWTISFWLKRTALATNGSLFGSGTNGSNYFLFYMTSGDVLRCEEVVSGANTWNIVTTPVYRDPSSWYHIVFAFDSTQATSSNRIKLYVNGSQVTAFSTATYPTQNLNSSYWNATSSHNIGAAIAAGVAYGNGYMTEVNFIDGSAKTPSDFGETDSATGVWKPKAYSGTYGTNGFELNFSDNSNNTAATLGKDISGNGNNWTPNNFSVTAGAGNDSMVDSPTAYGTDTGVGGEVRGNYATWNPLDKDDGITSVTNGNLNVVTNGSNGSIKSTIAFPSGKWYWEVTSDTVNSGGTQVVGIIPQSQPPTNNMSDSGKLGYALDVSFSDRKFENGTATSYGTYTQANGAVYMLAFDQDAGKLWYGINGTWLASGAPATGSNPSSSSISTSTAYCAAVSDNTVSGTFTANFGQRAFAYTAPSGFKALCTTNLPTPTIGATSTTQANDYFNVKTWTATGARNVLTGVGFQPSLIWGKKRSAVDSNVLVDAVRGVTKELYSDATTAETTNANGVESFDSDGFTLVGSGSGSGVWNGNTGATHVAWLWNAGGSNATNTSGTITSTVRANTTSGFSIVTYTGTGSNATVGHGLGVAPDMVIVKRRDTTGAWPVRHTSITAANTIYLNTTAASASATTVWNSTVPSSTVFSIGTSTDVNASSGTYVAYCFDTVAGYSAFGSYVGNSSADGTFVYTGFRPRFLLFKNSTGADNWYIIDSARNTYNVCNARIFPNLSNAEDTTYSIVDFLSNGFKFRSSDGSWNSTSFTYIYAAFAESPFKYSLAR